ncbi:MAG: hypothetical protein NZ811_00060 [Gammaproteobacteria bacterium]|nr:hypothetical protein [Gammaproteobacteria bacterium]
MELLARNNNAKLIKTAKKAKVKVALAGLSLMPSLLICANSKKAKCLELCLKDSGFSEIYDSVNLARQRKTDYFLSDRTAFLEQIKRELTKLNKYAKKTGKLAIVRLNVLSDIPWERYDIPQQFPDIKFYDYTKRSSRLGRTPSNYGLMFSWSGAPEYQREVNNALKTDTPITVVFSKELPEYYLGREVYDGDLSDLDNLDQKGKVIGLRLKGNKNKRDFKANGSDFVVDSATINHADERFKFELNQNLIPLREVA